MYLFGQAIWGHIWKRTVEKSQTNAPSVILHLLGQAIWGHIWKRTVKKSQTNAPSVILHLLGQAIWGHIWKHTVEKSQTNVTNVTMHALRQAVWGDIWKCTLEKDKKCNQCDYAAPRETSLLYIWKRNGMHIIWQYTCYAMHVEPMEPMWMLNFWINAI